MNIKFVKEKYLFPGCSYHMLAATRIQFYRILFCFSFSSSFSFCFQFMTRNICETKFLHLRFCLICFYWNRNTYVHTHSVHCLHTRTWTLNTYIYINFLERQKWIGRISFQLIFSQFHSLFLLRVNSEFIFPMYVHTYDTFIVQVFCAGGGHSSRIFNFKHTFIHNIHIQPVESFTAYMASYGWKSFRILTTFKTNNC